MMRKLLYTLFFLLSSIPAIAASEGEGLAMHGAPKYAPGFAHFTYANPDAPKGGTLRLPATGTFDTLNPYAIKGNAAQGLNYVYDRLMARVWDEPFTLYPLIAQRVEVPADRSSLTVHIDPRARFSDGSAVKAEDVIFSFETLRDSGRPNMRRVYALAEKAEKLGDLSVKFTFGPGRDRETVMIFAMMPVLSKAWWSGRTFDSAVLEPPVTNGPYKIARVEPGRRIVYERDPGYWAKDLPVNVGHYNFDRITYDYFRDETVSQEAFKSGDYDLRREWDAGKWASNYDFPAVRDGRVKLEALPHGRPERVRSFIFNTRRAPFDDIRVRKALGLLLDFEWMNANLYHNQYRRITSYYPNAELAAVGAPSPAELALLEPFRESLSPDVFGPVWTPPPGKTPQEVRANMRAADALLKDAGWTVQNGTRMKDGKTLSFEILLGAPEDEKTALAFVRPLQKMGIKAQVRVLDSAGFIARLNDYDFDMTLYFWLSTLSPGTEQYLYWSCEAAKQPARWNYAGVCHPAVDSLSKSIADAASREDLLARTRALDRVLMHGHYMIPLYYAGKDYVAYWHSIVRPDTTPLYGMVTETWWATPARAAAGKK